MHLISPLQFEVYFTLRGVLTEGLTVSVVAQLGAGATAGHWKVDLYEFVGKDDWTNIGDLTDCELPVSYTHLTLPTKA